MVAITANNQIDATPPNSMELKNQTMKHDKPCCEVLEELDIGWMRFDDGSRCAPFIMGKNDQTMWRVNHCPSCGEYISKIVLKKEEK